MAGAGAPNRRRESDLRWVCGAGGNFASRALLARPRGTPQAVAIAWSHAGGARLGSISRFLFFLPTNSLALFPSCLPACWPLPPAPPLPAGYDPSTTHSLSSEPRRQHESDHPRDFLFLVRGAVHVTKLTIPGGTPTYCASSAGSLGLFGCVLAGSRTPLPLPRGGVGGAVAATK